MVVLRDGKDNDKMTTPSLETTRLVLRPIDPSDWDALNAMMSDTVAMEHMDFKSWTEEQRRELFDAGVELGKQPNPDRDGWAIERTDSRAVIGWIWIGIPNDPTTDDEISVAYALARSHWNHGFMTEALRAVLAYEFETQNTPQVSAHCRTANGASARVMEKAGMGRVGSNYEADSEGNQWHQHHYVITRAEYQSQHS